MLFQLGDRHQISLHYGACLSMILICGTGLGMAITANKLSGVYAGACSDIYAAERSARSNNAQIIAIGAPRVTGLESAKLIPQAFIEAKFQGDRSLAKFTRIQEIENEIADHAR